LTLLLLCTYDCICNETFLLFHDTLIKGTYYFLQFWITLFVTNIGYSSVILAQICFRFDISFYFIIGSINILAIKTEIVIQSKPCEANHVISREDVYVNPFFLLTYLHFWSKTIPIQILFTKHDKKNRKTHVDNFKQPDLIKHKLQQPFNYLPRFEINKKLKHMVWQFF
jgi:hypothetical protein